MRIVVRVCTDNGWQTYAGDAPEGSDVECYALPKIDGEAACRAEFWSQKLGLEIPTGRALIWQRDL